METPMGEDILKRLAPRAARDLMEAIEEAGGNEVFFAGTLNKQGLVESVRVCARGHQGAVPAMFEGLQVREVVLHNHPSGELRPSQADLELAAAYGNHGHGVYIVDNLATRVYVVVEPFLDKEMHLLNIERLMAMFTPSSGLAKALPRFEVRPQQQAMMEQVAHAFNTEGVAVIEAPTGVGKTVAYLVPSIRWALDNKERVVVSTRTINLQEQIVLKDIPLLRKALGEDFSTCLVKGRGNYVCWRKLQRAFSEATLFDDEAVQAQFDAIAEWVENTEDGSKSDLPFVPDRELWERLCSESDTCAMSRCPNQKRCFVTKARRAIARADIVVVNHHMLFSDLAIKKEAGDFSALAILPAYRRLIFDEAHSIEESATEYFGANATRLGALATLGRLHRRERMNERGLIPLLRARLIKDCSQLDVRAFEHIQKLLDEQLVPQLQLCRDACNATFSALREFAAGQCQQIGRDIKWRLTEGVLAAPELRALHETEVLPTVDELRRLTVLCKKLWELLDGIPPAPDEMESPVLTEMLQLRAYGNRIERMANVLAEITSEELARNTVRWIELDAQNDKFVRLARCPLEVDASLAEWVYEPLSTVVLTSATLAVDQKFDYLFGRLGLNSVAADRVDTLILDSPFDFHEQAMLGVVTDLPEPNDKGFLDASVEAIRLGLHASRGHAFVLFTSFKALNIAYRSLAEELRRAGITPLRQGQAGRTDLLEQFRVDAASVLFGTDSFWEGVDVAGDSLQCVILPKLPFRVPTEPVLEARAEAIEAAGGNAFMAYAVPQAVIKFRQGFGRLIRGRSDRGVVLVLDKRVATKFYGKVFLRSLPQVRTVKGPARGVMASLAKFLGTPENSQREGEQ